MDLSHAAAWRDGVVEPVVAGPSWHRAASTFRCIPRSCAVTSLWAIPAVSPLLRSSRCVGSILQSSVPSKSGCRTHRITALGPPRGDTLRREVFSCVYWNTILQHLLHSCMHHIKKNNVITILCNTQQVAIWYFLQIFLSKPLADLYFMVSVHKIKPWYWTELFLVRIKQ